MGEAEEILLAIDGGPTETSRLLDEDDIPNANQSLTCFSCDTPMVGLYCHACGNKNDNYRRSIWRLVVEMLANLSAIDNRMWRSLWSLLRRPGRMAREYADGARTRWTSPVRFYLAASFMLFGYIALSGTQLVALKQAPPDASVQVRDGTDTDLGAVPAFFVRKGDLRPGIADSNAAAALSGFLSGLNGNMSDEQLAAAEAELRKVETQIAATNDARRRERLIEKRDVLQNIVIDAKAARGEATDADGDAGADADDGLLTVQRGADETLQLDGDDLGAVYDRILRNPQVINRDLNNRLKLTMFFMLPFAMLLGAVFIRGKQKALLYDHLVHAAYIHGFSFLLLLIFILLHQFTALPGLLTVYSVILLVYLPLSARGMFGRGWFKSVLTAWGVGAVYTLIVMTAGTTYIAIGLNEVAEDMNLGTPASVDDPAATPPITD